MAVGAWGGANGEIATEWRKHAECPFPWKPCVNSAGVLGTVAKGEGGGLFVSFDAFGGRRAYMKPTKKALPMYAKAAREKIASDLAFEVGVAVPPVMLATRDRPPMGEERHVCVSLVMFQRQWSWFEVKGWVSDTATTEAAQLIKSKVPAAASRAFAFDTWLDQTDHGGECTRGAFEGHNHNIIFGYDATSAGEGSFVFLDYAYSLGAGERWKHGGASNCVPANFPHRMLKLLDKQALAETVQRIEDTPSSAVEGVLSRIPVTHLEPEFSREIQEGLLSRRSLVRKALADYL